MIKWNCSFNIPDSSIQCAEAHIKILSYENINDHSNVNVLMFNKDEDVVIKEYTKEFQRTFDNEDEIYEELIKDFEDAEIVS